MSAIAPVRVSADDYPAPVDLEATGRPGLHTAGAEKSAKRLRRLWTRRKLLVKTAVVGLTAGLLFAFLLPRRYVSAVKLMPPNPQSGQGAAMVAALSAKSGMPAMVGNLLGIDGSGALFVGILESRTIQDRLVERFDLKKVYWDRMEEDACKDPSLRTAISEERKSGIITIAVSDARPQRAAAIAQAYVEELDRLSAELSTSAAHRERVFLEERLRTVKQDLDEASREFSQFASRNSAIDIKEQGRTMVEAAARLQGELIAAQSQIKGLEEIYSPNNVRVRSVEARIAELQKQLDKLAGSTAEATGEVSTPSEASPAAYPSIRQLPLLGVKYADLYRRTRIQEAVYETLTQQYELAKVQEAKETPSVKVLDQASLPQRKSSPSRMALIFSLTSAGLALGHCCGDGAGALGRSGSNSSPQTTGRGRALWHSDQNGTIGRTAAGWPAADLEPSLPAERLFEVPGMNSHSRWQPGEREVRESGLPPPARAERWTQRWSPERSFTARLGSQRLRQFVLGLTDQGCSVGAMFLVNVMLARTQSKEEYGTFVLSYSIFTFLAGLHNAAVLEPYTVYGSGRYRKSFPAYSRLMLQSNVAVGMVLAAALLLVCCLLRWVLPGIPVRGLMGLGLVVGIILTGSFLRRSYYIRRQPAGAATASAIFFVTVLILLSIAVEKHLLDSFSVFLILGLGWVTAGIGWLRGLPQRRAADRFLDTEPRYWREHWRYARWVLAMSFVFQFMHQGYYWLVAGLLSVKEAADLKAMYVLIAPVEQVMISLSFLMLPALTARYAARNFAGFVSLWKRYTTAMAAITLLFALAVRLLGAAAMHILYAGKFDGLAPLLFLLALVPVCMGVAGTLSDAIRAAERPRLVFFAYVSSAIVTFAAGVPLVIHLGLRGAVYGMSLSGATFAGALAVAFWLYVPRHGSFADEPPQSVVLVPGQESR